MVYTNKNHVQYIHRAAALSFICVVMKARGWNSTWPKSPLWNQHLQLKMVLGSIPWWISGRRNVGMCPSWLWSVWVYGFLLFWSPLLCNSWLVQWQSADGGSCSTLQGIVSIVFPGGIPIEDCLAGLLHSLGSCPGNSYRQSSFPDEERSLFPSNDLIHLQYIFCFCLT